MNHPFVTNITAPDPATIEVRENGRIYFDGSYIGSYRHNQVTSAPYGLQQVPAENIAAVLNLVSDAIHAKAMGPQPFADFQNKLYGTNIMAHAHEKVADLLQEPPLHTMLLEVPATSVTPKEQQALENHVDRISGKSIEVELKPKLHINQLFAQHLVNDLKKQPTEFMKRLTEPKVTVLKSFRLLGFTFFITQAA